MGNGSNYQIIKALIAVVATVTIGTFGFALIDGTGASIGDCLYMTIITLSTVGYGEVIPLSSGGRIFASVLILFGMGSLIYFGSTVIAFWVELDMQKTRRRKRMEKNIRNIADHIIICGVGTTGSHVVREMIAAKRQFVCIENNGELIKDMVSSREFKNSNILYIIGDATDDNTLHKAGIKKAGGLVAVLPNDKDNLYIILSARQFNKKMRIISRATERDAGPKMVHAGADQVVSPNLIGGMRIASEMIRPQVVKFLDMMLREQEQNVRIEQVSIPSDSDLVGRRLVDTKIRKTTDVLVIAIKSKNGNYKYNPGPDTEIRKDDVLIVLGAMDSVVQLRKSICGREGETLVRPQSTS